MFEGEKKICSIPCWMCPIKLNHGTNYWYLWKLKNRRTIKTCIVIRMIPDGNPLIHVKQSKNMCCVVSKKLDLKKRDFFYSKYIFQYKLSQEDI